MELNVKQKSVVEVLHKHYNKDTVTRSEINDLVKSGKIKNPSWLIPYISSILISLGLLFQMMLSIR
mgnify:CR=1 FL=1